MIDKIDLMQGLNINPIPLEFSQSLTTAEWLCHLQAKVNEVIGYIENLESNANKYTDIKVSELLTELVLVNKRIDTCKAECHTYTDEQLAAMKIELISKITDVENTLIAHNKEFVKIYNNLDELRDMVSRGDVTVISPATGAMCSIQQALNDIYNNIRVTITWADIESVGLTWDTVESWNATWSEVEYNISNYVEVSSSTFALRNNYE